MTSNYDHVPPCHQGVHLPHNGPVLSWSRHHPGSAQSTWVIVISIIIAIIILMHNKNPFSSYFNIRYNFCLFVLIWPNACHANDSALWILKWGGVEISGGIMISLG